MRTLVTLISWQSKDGITETGRPFSLLKFMRSRKRFWTLFGKVSVNSIWIYTWNRRFRRFNLLRLVTKQLSRLESWLKTVESKSIYIAGYAYNQHSGALEKKLLLVPLPICRFFCPVVRSSGDTLIGHLSIGRICGTLTTVGWHIQFSRESQLGDSWGIFLWTRS